ncbi:MAG: hypothetical protein R2781_06640 [Flavobacteriaceae bacterium]
MITKNQLLHTAKINNNCPECFSNDGLEFSFSQKEIETKLYKKASKAIEETLFCHTCKHIIYPVNWTEDIERVYQYHKKLVAPKNSSVRLKPLALTIIFVDIIIVAAIAYYFISR